MADPISDNAMNTLFRRARSFNDWTDAAVPEVLMRAAYDLAKWGPTSANASPARFIFLPKDSDGRERLKPHLLPTNVDKTMTAPWTVILAHDLHFHEKIPELFPPQWHPSKRLFPDGGARARSRLRTHFRF